MRLLALDVDGTVLGSDHQVSAATLESVRTVVDSGVEVVLASSRGPNGLRPVFSALGMVGGLAVSYQGALLCQLYLPDGVEVFFESRLPVSWARSIISLAQKKGLSVGWYTAERWEVLHLDEAILREAEITGEFPTISDAPSRTQDAPHKVLCISGEQHLLPTLRELSYRLPEGCTGQFSHENYLEITLQGVDKVPALETLIQKRCIAREETVAIGDGENDAGMLRWAGIGICMGHAPDSVKAAADWITETNDRNGVAVAIEKLQDRGWI